MDLDGRRILITGASGFVGSNLVRRLLSEGARVRATLYSHGPVVEDDRIDYMQADLTLQQDCERAVEGQSILLHCAASTSGAATIAATPMVHVTPNVVMNSLILEAAHQAGVEKVVWLSSTTGYPPTGDSAVREEEMFEGEPFEKYHFVGWMKRFTELLCRMYGEKLEKRMTTVVLRPTNIYGPADDFEPATSHVTAALIRKVVERQTPLEVWGTGDDVRDVVYVDDMVEAIILAAQKDIEGYMPLNVGLGKAYSVNELLAAILEIDGFGDARIEFNPARPTMIPIRLVDLSNAERVLGFRPGTGLREGLRRTIDWYRASRCLPRPDSS